VSADKPRRLGRGLEALLADTGTRGERGERAERDGRDAGEPTLQRVPIAEVRANPYQPRKEFRPEELDELEASLKASGLLQPITVRRPAIGGGYELIAGERRLRAATRLGWTDIPAIVREVDDRTLLTLALVENLQRADLNPLEEAEGYQRLIEEFGLTQQQVAEVVGKDRTTVTNILRVLALPPSVRRMLGDGTLTLGHARAILAAGSEQAMADLARVTVAEGLSVRAVEQRAREGTRRLARTEPKARVDSRPAAVRRIEDELRRHFQTDVRVHASAGERGTIAIEFYSADDLERIMDLVLGDGRERY
jgi:ParB family chromosome partitioning protein